MKTILFVFLSLPLAAMDNVQGWCEKGAQVVVAPQTVGGSPITRSFQQSYPSCTVNVYITGSGGIHATIFSTNSGTALSNPFTATNLGYWNFYVANGTYDIQISGGGLPAPLTFGAVLAFDYLAQSELYLSQSFANNTSGGYIHLPPVTYPNSSCLDQYGNPVNIPVPSAGFPAFNANDTIMWVSASPLSGVSPPGCATALAANLTYGLNLNSYILAMGGLATSSTSFNAVHALSGGVTAGSFTGGIFYPAGTVTTTGTLVTGAYLGGYIQTGHSNGAPASGTIATVTNPLTQFDGLNQGTMYWDDGLVCLRVYSGSTWSCLATSASTTPPGGVNTSVQFNNSGVFGGTTNFVWDNVNQILTVVAKNATNPGMAVGSGFIQADAGFLAKGSTATSFNSIQAPGGGMFALSATMVNYTQLGNHNGIPPATAGDSFNAGAVYYDTGAGTTKLYNGTSWVNLGGGGGSPGGANTNVQFNSSGTFGGSANLTYASQLLTSVAVDAAHAGMVVTTGFMQADQGFLATSGTANNYNVINAPTGGYGGLSATMSKYVQIGAGAAAPSVTTGDTFHAGTLYYNTTSDCMEIRNNAGTFNCASTSGGAITSINTLTAAAITLAGTTHEIILTSSGGNTITFTTPQAIDITSNVTFLTATTAGFVATNSGGAFDTKFSTDNSKLLIDYSGDITVQGIISTTSNVVVQNGGSGQVTLGASSWLPGTTNIVALGSSTKAFSSAFFGSSPSSTGIVDIGTGNGTALVVSNSAAAANTVNFSNANASGTVATIANSGGPSIVTTGTGLGLSDLGGGISTIGPLTVVGKFEAESHWNNSTTGTVSITGVVGVGGPAVIVVGSDTRGIVTVTAGLVSAFNITFGSNYSSVPACVVSPSTYGNPPAITVATNQIAVQFASNTTLTLYYICIGRD